jgi:hypothetical protein
MEVAVLKFTTATLTDGTLEVSGPSNPEPGTEVKHLRFAIAQGDVMVEAEGSAATGGWTGSTQAGGLKPGDAHGYGVALLFKESAPPSFETFTWLEQVTLTG